jgi:ABC-2 type transport system permease protein
MRRILFLAWAEVLHITRDRATLTQMLMMPMIQLLVLSNAATFKVRETPTYVVDFDRSTTSRRLVSRFTASGHFRVIGQSLSTEEANEALLHGRATAALTIPHDFEASLVRFGVAPVELSVNAEKGQAAGIVQFYAFRILNAHAAEVNAELHPQRPMLEKNLDEAPPARGAGRIDLRVRSWYNPTLDYRHYMVPGILVLLVTMIGTLLTAQNIAREKELGTLEQLNVTPITKGQFLAAKLLPFWVLAMIELAMGLTLGKLVFGIPIRGSLFLFFGSAAIYMVVALGIGLFISTLVETQQQAMFVTFFIVMIYNLMSGLFTPIDSMPQWVQWLAELNPVRHFVQISRAVLVKGAGPAEIARPLIILVVYAVVVFTFAVRQYTKRTA